MGQGLSSSSTELTVLNKRVLQREKEELASANLTNRRSIVVHVPCENGYCGINGPQVELSRSIKDSKQHRFSHECKIPDAVSEERKPLYLQRRLERAWDADSIISVGSSSSASPLYTSTSSDSTSYSSQNTDGESRSSSAASRRTYTVERRVRESANNPVGFSSRSDFHQYLMQPSIKMGSEKKLIANSAWDQNCEESDADLEIGSREHIGREPVEPFISTCWGDFEEIELLGQPLIGRNELPWKQRTDAFCLLGETENQEDESECDERTAILDISAS